MESIRQNKVARLVQKELAEFFRRDSKAIVQDKMVSVTVVRITADLSIAKIYISIFPEGGEKESVKTIQQHSGMVRNYLGKKIRHQVKKIPELHFFLDDSINYSNRIDELLNT